MAKSMHFQKFRTQGLAAGASLLVLLAATACGGAQATGANAGGTQATAAKASAPAQASAPAKSSAPAQAPAAKASAPAQAAAAQQLTMHASEFAFAPKTVQLKVGQPVQLTIVNDGQVDHDIKSDLPVSSLKYVKADNDASEQKDNAAKGVFDVDFNKGHSAQVSFVPTKTGTFAFDCDEAGHKEAGMTGSFLVQ